MAELMGALIELEANPGGDRPIQAWHAWNRAPRQRGQRRPDLYTVGDVTVVRNDIEVPGGRVVSTSPSGNSRRKVHRVRSMWSLLYPERTLQGATVIHEWVVAVCWCGPNIGHPYLLETDDVTDTVTFRGVPATLCWQCEHTPRRVA